MKLRGTKQQFREYLQKSDAMHLGSSSIMCPLAHWKQGTTHREVFVYHHEASVRIAGSSWQSKWYELPAWMVSYVEAFDRAVGEALVDSQQALKVLEALDERAA